MQQRHLMMIVVNLIYFWYNIYIWNWISSFCFTFIFRMIFWRHDSTTWVLDLLYQYFASCNNLALVEKLNLSQVVYISKLLALRNCSLKQYGSKLLDRKFVSNFHHFVNKFTRKKGPVDLDEVCYSPIFQSSPTKVPRDQPWWILTLSRVFSA